MPLNAVKVKNGTAFTLYFLEENDECALMDFLKYLPAVESDRIDRYMKRTAEIGLIMNPEISKCLGDGRFEWRTRGGVRIFYFTDVGKVIICTNGYVKKKDKHTPAEIERLEKWRAKYFEAKKTNQLKYVESEL
jgi:hypothetical protein